MHARYLLPGSLSLSRTGDSLWEILPTKMFCQRLLIDGDPYWSWSYGLGGDTFTEFSFFYTTSPFFYLETGIMGLFGADFTDVVLALRFKLVFSVCKLFLILLLMYRLLIYDGHYRLHAFLGAVCYGVGCRFLYYAINADFMTDAYVYLPLIMLAFRRYQRDGAYLPLIVSVALCVANSFYFGFINCFFFGLAFCVFLWEKGMGTRAYLSTVGKVALISLCGVLLSAVVFLPSVNGLINTARDAYGGGWALLPSAQEVKKLSDRLFSWDTVLALPLFLTPVLLAAPKRLSSLTRKKCLIAAFYVLMFGFPPFWRLMGGLGYPTDRWQYVAAFALAYLVPDVMEQFPFAKRRFSFLAGAGVCIGTAVLFLDRYDGVRSITNLCWLLCAASMCAAAVSLTLLGTNKEKRFYRLLEGFLVLCVACSGLLYSVSLRIANIPYETAEGVLLGTEAQQSFAKSCLAEEGVFFRTHDMSLDEDGGRPESRSFLNGAYTLSAYGSMVDGELFRWMHHTHNVYSKLVEPNQYRSLDNRLFLETAWGVRYKLPDADAETTPDGWTEKTHADGSRVYENDHNVGFDLWYDGVISKDAYEKLNYAEKDAALLQGAYVEEAGQTLAPAKLDNVTECLSLAPDSFTLQNCTLSNGVLTAGEEASLTLPLTARDGAGEYLFSFQLISTDGRTFTVFANGRESCRMADDANWVLHLNQFSFCIPGDETAITLTVSPGEYLLSDCMLYHNSYRALPGWTERLNKYEMTNLRLDGSKVSGSISVEDEGILALSMPFNSGWRCLVNGNKTKLFRVNGVFTGMLLSPGTYDIELKFTPPYLLAGGIVSMITALGLAAAMLQRKRRKVS